MASFTDIPTASLAADKYVTYDLLTALRDNTLASVWHPYNKTTIGDANTGLIYDYGVSGAVSSVVTPDFADGWEYMIVYNDLSHDSGGSPPYTLQVELYCETSAAYSGAKDISDTVNTITLISGHLHLPWVRSSRTWQPAHALSSVGNAATDASVGFSMSTAQKALRARVSFSGGYIDAGKLYLYRRGVFAAG